MNEKATECTIERITETARWFFENTKENPANL